MLRLFQSPLRPKNAKVGTSELVPDRSAPTEHNHRQGDGTPKTTIVNQMKRAAQESRIDSRPMVATRSTTSTRPSRSRRLAPVHDVEDTPEESNVSKFSVDKGLGERWAK
jgi:sentrin-specific protease 7